jgi:Ca2+/Na+ antiporter
MKNFIRLVYIITCLILFLLGVSYALKGDSASFLCIFALYIIWSHHISDQNTEMDERIIKNQREIIDLYSKIIGLILIRK